MPGRDMTRACEACRRRASLLVALAGHLEHHRYDRQRLIALLAMSDEDLMQAVSAAPALRPGDPQGSLLSAPEHAETVRRVDPEHRPSSATPESPAEPALCRHDGAYPELLAAVSGAPAVLHMAGDVARVVSLLATPAVAIVGARAPTDYGREVARDLARGLAASGVCVVSGMAMGIDAAAHAGALETGGSTLAVMPGGANVAYPACKRALHRRLCEQAGAISELPAGARPRRWCFVARNRIIAALARVTVVVEARDRSGALITAGYARDLGREVAAVPGPVTSSRSRGANALIRDGAHLVRDPQDILDLLYGVGMRRAQAGLPSLEPRLLSLLEHVRAGQDTVGALVGAGMDLDQTLSGLTELELEGCLRRSLGGRYVPVLR
jgi:DNA processing protein